MDRMNPAPTVAQIDQAIDEHLPTGKYGRYGKKREYVLYQGLQGMYDAVKRISDLTGGASGYFGISRSACCLLVLRSASMPRVHTRKAGKDYPEQGIKKGDTYYAWAFYRSPERKSKTPPKRQQLTQRDELIAIYDAEDAFNEVGKDVEIEGALADVIAKVDEAIEAANDKLSNLEQAFQGGNPQIEELNDFVSACEDVRSELESFDADEKDELPDVSWPG